jgi:hypothetical protein
MEAAGTPIKDPSKLKPVCKELITEGVLAKSVATKEDFEQTLEMLI